ncbi:hypothetical protein JCM10212_002545 [Sporobolomyces blumeae]
MGNNASTPSSSASQSHLARAARASPRPRNISLPSTDDLRPHRTGSVAERRKKKNLDPVDVGGGGDASGTGGVKVRSGTGKGSDHAGSNSARSKASHDPATMARLPSLGGRRKGSDRVPVVDNEADADGEGSDEVDDPDVPRPGSGVGTLRGAMQGKAEHVVYGPRRVDDGTGFVASPAPGGMGKVVPIKSIPTVGNATTARSDAVARGEMRSGSRRDDAGLSPIGESNGSESDSRGRRRSTAPMDPDDTMHPDYRNSPRLTSEVLMSTESMPVLSSPKGEEPPSESPFTPAEGESSTSDQQLASSAALAPGKTVASTSSASTLHNSSSGQRLTPSQSRTFVTPTTSFAGAASSIFAPTSPFSPTSPHQIPSHLPSEADLLPPHSSTPVPPSTAPTETVLAPVVPTEALPLSAEAIPSGTSVIASPTHSKVSTPTGQVPSPAVLLPPTLFNAPVAAIPIPLLSVPSETIAQNLIAAAVDLGAGKDGVPTLIKWKNEDGQEPAKSSGKPPRGPKEVYVTGTFANGWKVKIELRKTDPTDFSALISLPPGPHRLKFIVDNEWKASKHLPVATDADGNLINYLQVNPVDSKLPANLWTAQPAGAGSQGPQPISSKDLHEAKTASQTDQSGRSVSVVSSAPPAAVPMAQPPQSAAKPREVARSVGGSGPIQWPGFFGLGGDDDGETGGPGEKGVYDEDDLATWTQEIPLELEQWGEWESERDQIEADWLNANPNPTSSTPGPVYPPQPPSAGVPPPTLPAQLEKGPLNHAAYVTMGSGDDNSILPKPDHSVINHLAASPIKGGFLSVGVTTRYKRKFVTIVYYKALAR